MSDIGDLNDGRFVKRVDLAMKQAAEDCACRPGDKSPRSVTITIKMVPVPTDIGESDRVTIVPSVAVKLPKQIEREIEMSTSIDGALGFNPASPDDVYQGTIDEIG